MFSGDGEVIDSVRVALIAIEDCATSVKDSGVIDDCCTELQLCKQNFHFDSAFGVEGGCAC